MRVGSNLVVRSDGAGPPGVPVAGCGVRAIGSNAGGFGDAKAAGLGGPEASIRIVSALADFDSRPPEGAAAALIGPVGPAAARPGAPRTGAPRTGAPRSATGGTGAGGCGRTGRRAGAAGGGVPGRADPGAGVSSVARTDCRATFRGSPEAAAAPLCTAGGAAPASSSSAKIAATSIIAVDSASSDSPGPPGTPGLSGSARLIAGHGARSRTSSPGLCGPSSCGPRVTAHRVSRSLGTPGTRSEGGTGAPLTLSLIHI